MMRCELLTKKIIKMVELKKAFIEGYKQRANESDLIFDDISKLYAEKLFKDWIDKQCDIPVVVRSAYLVQQRETLINHGLFDSEEKAKSYIKGSTHDFAIQKVNIA